MKNLLKIFIWISGLLSLLAALFFFWYFYFYYLAIDFNEEGRFFDPQELVVYRDSNFAAGILGGGFLLIAILLFYLNKKFLSRKSPSTPLAQ